MLMVGLARVNKTGPITPNFDPCSKVTELFHFHASEALYSGVLPCLLSAS